MGIPSSYSVVKGEHECGNRSFESHHISPPAVLVLADSFLFIYLFALNFIFTYCIYSRGIYMSCYFVNTMLSLDFVFSVSWNVLFIFCARLFCRKMVSTSMLIKSNSDSDLDRLCHGAWSHSISTQTTLSSFHLVVNRKGGGCFGNFAKWLPFRHSNIQQRGGMYKVHSENDYLKAHC